MNRDNVKKICRLTPSICLARGGSRWSLSLSSFPSANENIDFGESRTHRRTALKIPENDLRFASTPPRKKKSWADVCPVLSSGFAVPCYYCMQNRRPREPLLTRLLSWIRPLQHTGTHCNTLLNTATHCNTLQHTLLIYGLDLLLFGIGNEILIN